MKLRRSTLLLLSCALLLALIGCTRKADPAAELKLQGAGASFPAPLYDRWFKEYTSDHQNILVDYQSVGSGNGVKSVLDHTVDFGASGAAMKPRACSKYRAECNFSP